MATYSGKFIVIDGPDGSGKATQTALLVKRLKLAGLAVETADFPQYEKKSAGLVEKYLAGKYGSLEEVGPYRASIFYAADRYDASFRIRRWLKAGKIVIANRYVTANLAHQGGKISDALERKHFFNWLNSLEYEIFAIPKPDLNIILHLPAEISRLLIKRRQLERGLALDIHEIDLKHLMESQSVYLEIAKSLPRMSLIDCVKDGRLMGKKVIGDLIWQEAKKIVDLPPATSGLDLYSADYYSLLPGRGAKIKTSAKINLAEEFSVEVTGLDELSKNGIHALAKAIPSPLSGQLDVILINLSQDIFHIAPGDKIGKLIIKNNQAC